MAVPLWISQNNQNKIRRTTHKKTHLKWSIFESIIDFHRWSSKLIGSSFIFFVVSNYQNQQRCVIFVYILLIYHTITWVECKHMYTTVWNGIIYWHINYRVNFLLQNNENNSTEFKWQTQYAWNIHKHESSAHKIFLFKFFKIFFCEDCRFRFFF